MSLAIRMLAAYLPSALVEIGWLGYLDDPPAFDYPVPVVASGMTAAAEQE